MLWPSAAKGAKKLLVDDKIAACVKEICLLDVVCKVSDGRPLSGETFAFLKNVCYQDYVLCLEQIIVFLRDADWPTTNFLGRYCYFSVIRLANFVRVIPVTVVAR